MEVLDDETLDVLEKRIEELRIAYEQFFLGSRKRAPEQEKTSVLYLIRRLANQHTTNTKIRFRFQQLTSKFNAYNQYWARVMTQIEMGRYQKDKFKMELKAKPLEAPGQVQPAPEQSSPAQEKQEDDERPKIDQLYEDFIRAKRELNQPTDTISKEKLAATIEKQLPKLKEKYKGKKVEFRVVVENGQAKLKVHAR